ncbi:MAG: NAD(P)H-dependent oxidoreductase subunit E, partial [Gammaproteobacteria bacterium]
MKTKTAAERKGRFRGRRAQPAALEEVRALIGAPPWRRDLLIEYLHAIQDRYQAISAEHVVALAECLALSMTEVYEVATFYHHFDVVREDSERPPALTVRVCESITCSMFGAAELAARLRDTLGDGVRVQGVPCVGRCHGAPVAVVGQNPLERACAEDVVACVGAGSIAAPPTAHLDYAAYRAGGGYALLAACQRGEHAVDDIIATLADSKLRGLGGAGFPAGRKWSILREQPAPRLLAVNIDEGEPGTFKDRYYLERDPHRFLEGMLIAAWAVEADACYIYLRDEYAGCRAALADELERLRADPPCTLPPIELRRG